MNDVGKFIGKFQNPEEYLFSNDCSYWFAVILYYRFIREGSKLMFDVAEKHFGVMIHGRVYDITGDVTEKYKWISWIEFQDKTVKKEVIDKYIMFIHS